MLSFVFTKTENEPNEISEATGYPVETQCLRLTRASATPQPPLPRDAFNASLQRKISISRTDLVLLNSNPKAQIIATDQQEYYENFYTTGDADHGITNVHTYKTVTYKSIYPNIDMVIQAKEQGMEYSFIVHPGGKVSDIQLQWNGLEGIKKLKDSKIEYSLALGTLEESAPKSFTEGKVVPSRFIKNRFNYGFKVGNYDKGKDLIIDPTLVWGTYYGGGGIDYAYAISTDHSGNVLITGKTGSSSGIATIGAYQTSNQGSSFLAKFNSGGSLIWATYYGGNTTISNDVITDTSSNIYIAGYADSKSLIATSGAYQTSNSGGDDAFLAKFNSSGMLQWGTYYGGTGTDNGYGVATDRSGNVYLTGSTSSTSGVATSGANQASFAGSSDAFLVKFNSSGTRQWGTYYGGSGGEAGYAVTVNNIGDIYITGIAASTSGVVTNGAYQTSKGGGGTDAFLAKYDSSGTQLWATYYGGNYEDYGRGVTVDGSGNAYITGYTSSSNKIATNGAYQTAYAGANPGGTYDVFLAKFNSNGNLQWATYYGGSGDDNAYGITTDISGNIYLAGSTYSTTGIATSGAYQTSMTSVSGGNDAFLAQFNSTGSLQWATYYGGSVYGEGHGVATNASNDVYFTGYTLSNNNIATSGAYQTSITGGNYDVFLVKFSFKNGNDAGINSIQNPSPSTVCAKLDTIKVNLKNWGSSNLTKVSISWFVNHKAQTSYSWMGNLKSDSSVVISVGTYSFIAGRDTISAWTTLPNNTTDSGPLNDTSTSTIIVNPLPDANWSATNKCEEVTFVPKNLTYNNYQWSFGNGDTSLIKSPVYDYKSKGSYITKLVAKTVSGCQNEFDSTIVISCLSGIEKVENQTVNISLYPNPFQSSTTIAYNLNHPSKINIILLDITGKQIATIISQNQIPGAYQFDINVEKYHLNPGVYLLKFMMDDEVVSRRLVKF